MAGAIRELPDSGAQSTSLTGFAHTRRYSVAGYTRSELYALAGASNPIGTYTDQDLVELAAESIAPTTIGGGTRQTVATKPLEDFAGEAWEVEFGYASGTGGGGSAGGGTEPTEGESSYSFEAGVASVTQTTSLATTAYVKTGDPVATEFNSGVNYSRADDRFAGAEVQIPTFGFSETHYQPATFGSTTDINTIYSMTATVNSTPFRGFAAGEVLYLGSSGSKRTSGLWEVSYRFEAAPNVAALSIGDITSIAKKGWEYLWVLWKESGGTGGAFEPPVPQAVYVERLYKEASLAALGIGV